MRNIEAMNLIPTLNEQQEPSLRRALLGWLMRVANRHPLHRWYDNKAIMLEFYGERDGFDLQTVNAPCWDCAGRVLYAEGDEDYCQSCDGSGIHHTTRTVLIRRRVGCCVFHTPGKRWYLEDLKAWQAAEGYRSHLTRRIEHKPCDPRAAREAIGLILLLTGHYRQWWRMVWPSWRDFSFDHRLVVFPGREPGWYPQHVLAVLLAQVKRWGCLLRERWRGSDPVPF